VPKPGIWPRLAAIVAIVLVVVVLAISVLTIADDLRVVVVQVPLILVVMFAAWYALTREGRRRVLGVVVAVATMLACVPYLWLRYFAFT